MVIDQPPLLPRGAELRPRRPGSDLARSASIVILMTQSSTLQPVFKDAFVGEYLGIVRFLAMREALSRVHAEQDERAGSAL